MFDIEYLLIPEMAEILENTADFKDKVDFIFKLIDFEIYFKEYYEKIGENWEKKADERYNNNDYAFLFNEKAFITEYACKTKDTKKLFELINELANPEMYDYDTVVAERQNSISVIANIDDFEFSDEETKTAKKKAAKKTSLDVLLRFEPKK